MQREAYGSTKATKSTENLPLGPDKPRPAATLAPTLSPHRLLTGPLPLFLAAEEPDCGGTAKRWETSGIAPRVSATRVSCSLRRFFRHLHLPARSRLLVGSLRFGPSAFLQGPKTGKAVLLVRDGFRAAFCWLLGGRRQRRRTESLRVVSGIPPQHCSAAVAPLHLSLRLPVSLVSGSLVRSGTKHGPSRRARLEPVRTAKSRGTKDDAGPKSIFRY
jgi:hypothetical protein